jgi:hypothetical protein
MMKSIAARLMVACGLLCATAAVCEAQAYTPPPPPLTTLPPCPADKDAKKRAKRKDCDPTVYPPEKVETKGKKGSDATVPEGVAPAAGSAAEKHPFPGEQPEVSTPAAKAHPFPGDSAQDVPHDPAAEKRAAETPAGKANPYPEGATPDMPTDTAEPPAKPDDSGSASSSSSTSSSSSSDDAAANDPGKSSKNASKNPDDDDEDKPKLTDKGSEGKRSKKVIKPQTDTDRVDEDLSIAKFYGQSGNYTGAYLRAKDAVRTQPEYPEGHFVLGEAAKRLKKKDEAVAEFEAYLKLAPDGPQAKAAEKALEELR